MFDNLIESKPRRERSLGQSIFSVVAHLVIIALAVKLTSGAAETIKKVLADTNMMFIKPPDPPPPPPPPPPDQKVVVSANPPPQGFQTVVPPKVIPTEIPPVNLNEKFDAKNFSGKGVEGGIATGVIGGTGPVTTQDTYTEAQVDDPVAPMVCPEPRYPPALKTVGVTGQVKLQYVVGVNGRAEPGSVKVISTTNPAFADPAVETINKCTFKPAKMKGTAVRQLVEQNVRFTIGG